MTAIPEPTITLASLIDASHERRQDPPRPHMGASMLGHPCDRWLWLSFRWAVQEQFKGRILRLFRRGHHEENWIVQDLRSIGIHIHSTGGSQSRVDFGAHVSGSIDGIIEHGVPEAPKARHVAEFKTHSKKSFDQLVKDGVEKSKPVHFIQMQVYMLGTDIDRALYVAVCKDDDRIHSERVKLNRELAERYVNRGRTIATSDIMPPPLSTDKTWYQCKFCPAYDMCHNSKPTQHVNCRTCAHSTAKEDGSWRCELHEADGIPVEFQRKGCDSHVLHPHMVPWPADDTQTTDTVAAWVIGDKVLKNGSPGEDVYSSAEILANADACMSGDNIIAKFRSEFGGRVTG